MIEAMPHVLPMFSEQLINYTEETFKQNSVDILSSTKVKKVSEKSITIETPDKKIEEMPYGLLVWATGNTARPVISNLISKIPEQTQRRGLTVDESLNVVGAKNVYALGDCSATKFAPTAQVANKQGEYLAKRLNRIGYLESDKESNPELNIDAAIESLPRFTYSSVGILAYIGGDRAIADLPGGVKLGGIMTYYFWRSAYLSNLFTWRNKTLVASDWIKKTVFGRDISRE